MTDTAGPAPREREFAFNDGHFLQIRQSVYDYCGINLVDSKRDMVYSRLVRRLRATGIPTFDEYLDLALHDKVEFTELINAITTNLTAFFREAHHFEFLVREIVPAFLQRPASERLKIWSAGCSTGEEPYSIAIALAEQLPVQRRRQVSILATDVDHNVINKARAGVYPDDRVAQLDAGRIKAWFKRGRGANEGKVRIADALREMIQFRTLNLLSPWPMRGPVDVIFCRNVVIYFDKTTQRQLFSRMAALLVSRGYLFLGHSESLYQVSDRFESLGRTIYRRLD